MKLYIEHDNGLRQSFEVPFEILAAIWNGEAELLVEYTGLDPETGRVANSIEARSLMRNPTYGYQTTCIRLITNLVPASPKTLEEDYLPYDFQES
jgi:hypothetical protein